MNIKKAYYTMKQEEFKKYIEDLKDDENTMTLFPNRKTSYFYVPEIAINHQLLALHKAYIELNMLYSQFNDIHREMILQTYLIDEIQSTNKTENIYSTRSDIFSVLKDARVIRNKKIISIINAYNMIKDDVLDNQKPEDIKSLYERMMQYDYESKKDHLDGKLFRKSPVYITDGMKPVHTGFYPESEIIEGITEYLDLLHRDHLDLFLKTIIAHFMLETIHPFYDGNGRFGRYMMSYDIYQKDQSIYAYTIASAINTNKAQYYKALKAARDIHEFGCINAYVEMMCEILIEGVQKEIVKIKTQKQLLDGKEENLSMTKSEKKIYNLLKEASILTYFGISNEEIMSITGVSKRTLLSTIKKFREQDLLLEMKLGKVQFHKLNVSYGLEDD